MQYENAKIFEGTYPTTVEMVGHLKREPIRKDNEVVIVLGKNAIRVTIEINDSFYCKSDIKKELEQLFVQILKNYDWFF